MRFRATTPPLIILAAACTPPWSLEICGEPGCGDTTHATTSAGDGYMESLGVHTVTSEGSGGGGGSLESSAAFPESASSEPTAPPRIVEFRFTPDLVSQAGPAEMILEVDGYVTNMIVSLDGAVVAEGPPPLAYTYEATSQAKNGTPLTFEALALDDQGNQDVKTAELFVKLPASGTVRCTFRDELVAVSSGINAVVYDEEDLVAVGFRDMGGGVGPQMAVWRFEGETCAPVPGWPRALAGWTGLDSPKSLPSAGVAVSIDENGYLAVAGNLFDAQETRPYVALMTPEGSVIWETVGELGDQAAGITKVRYPYERIIMVGSRVSNLDDPPRYDALVIGYHEGTSPWVDVLKAPLSGPEVEEPDPSNLRSERLLAVYADPVTAEVLVVGERDYRALGALPLPMDRTFLARYYPDGGRIAHWTSPGVYLSQDSARSLVTCGDNAVVATGWTSSENGPRQPLVIWLDPALAAAPEHFAPPMLDAEGFGVGCDREGKVVVAGTSNPGGASDASIFAFRDPQAPLVWTAALGAAQVSDGARGLSCDSWGYCAWAGFESLNGASHAVLQIHAP